MKKLDFAPSDFARGVSAREIPEIAQDFE